MKSMLLYATVFLTGFAIMALELLGFRVLAPYFGYSIYVSGSLIGIVLAALSIGYIAGGRIADRNPRLEILWGIILAGSVLSFLGGILHRPVLDHLASMGPMHGALLGSVVLFGPAMVLLSMVSPFIIRIVSRSDAVGRSAGDVYGVATVGSIAGVFLTSFLLIPAVGGTATFNITGAVLLIVSVSGFVACRRYVAVAALALLGAFLIPKAQLAPGVLVEKESMYTRLAIIEKDGIRRLSIYRDQWWSSFDPGSDYLSGTVLDTFLIGPIIKNPARDVLILGMGGGTSLRQLLHFFPEIEHIDAVDIDPEVVRLADEYFGIRPSEKLSIHVSDARVFLSRTDKKYDFIEIDLFHQGPYIPFYVATREFFELLQSRLKGGGVIIYNVIAPDEDFTLLNVIGATMKSVIPSVYSIHAKIHGRKLPNVVLIGMKEPGDLNRLKRTLFDYPDEALSALAGQFSRSLAYFEPPDEALFLTDNRSNLEILNFKVVSRFLEKRRNNDEP